MSHSKEGLCYITDLPSVPRSLSTTTFCGLCVKRSSAGRQYSSCCFVISYQNWSNDAYFLVSTELITCLPLLHDPICSKSQLNQQPFLCSLGSIMQQDVIQAIAIRGYLQAHLPLYKGAGCCSAGYHWQASAWITQIKARDIHKISWIFSVMTEMDKIVHKKEIDRVL